MANLQRDIVQLIDFLNEHQPVKSKSSRAVSAAFTKMKEELDALNVKPERGRRKDLRRIERAVRSMRKIAVDGKKTS